MNSKSLIKFIISILMLIIVFRFIDFSELKNTLLNIPPLAIIFTVLLYALGQFISSYKWWTIASGSVNASYLTALRAYFIGAYVNCFGLGTVGGDVVRGLVLAGKKGIKTESLASVIADRAHGLAVLSLIGIFSVYALEQDRIDLILKLLLLGSALLIMLGWFIGPKIFLAVTPKGSRLREKVERIAAQFPREPKKLLFITLLSTIFHVVQITLNGYIAYAVGADIPWIKIFAVIPFVNILGTLPISWQGLGVRESALLFFLAGFITSEQAVAMGALWFLAMTTSSAIGGVIAAVTGDLALVSQKIPSKTSLHEADMV